jgi:hypothetical protein
MTGASTRGVIFVHSAPSALSPHIEWAVAGVLGVRVSLDWASQPAAPGTLRAELSWRGRPGTAARIASALRNWSRLRFEVTEDPSPGVEGMRYSGTPTLGIHACVIGVHGDVLVPENRLRSALEGAAAGDGDLRDEVDRLLGSAWDEELEPFRHAGDGAPVRWLHQVV